MRRQNSCTVQPPGQSPTPASPETGEASRNAPPDAPHWDNPLFYIPAGHKLSADDREQDNADYIPHLHPPCILQTHRAPPPGPQTDETPAPYRPGGPAW